MSRARTAASARLAGHFLFIALLFMFLFTWTRDAQAANPAGITVKAVNSWTQGNDSYVQYSVRLSNAQKKAITKWTIVLTMDRKVTVTDKWNASIKRSSKTLTLTPKSYNKRLARKGSTDIGFIIKSSGKASCTKAKVTVRISGKNRSFTKKISKAFPTPAPTKAPTPVPTKAPTPVPTKAPAPTAVPSPIPTQAPASGTPLKVNGRLKVNGTRLVNEKGKAVTLKGVSTHGITWFPEYVNKAAFQTLRDKWNVQCVRLALYTAEYNGYCTGGSQKKLTTLVENGVKYATELGMYVIIDWHILSDGNPATYQKQAVAFFREMSAKYKNHKNVIYEICNEPNGGTTWKQIKAYAETVIKVIRENDPSNLILVGTPTWSQDVDEAAKNPIKGYSNLLYTFHFYAGTHGESFRQKVQTAIGKGLPVFVSEFGICDASGNGSLNKTEAARWMTFLKKNGISFVCWNLSNKNESSALLKSSTKKTSGWTDSELSAQGPWFKGVCNFLCR